MKGWFLIGLVATAVLFVQAEVRSEAVPYANFVEITDKVLDALYEVEALFSRRGAGKSDGELAIAKFDSAIKRYDQHITAQKNLEGQQNKIVEKLQGARYYFSMYSAIGGDRNRVDGERFAREARDLFMVYEKEAAPERAESNSENKRQA